MTPETPSRSMTLVATGDSIAARRLVIPEDPAARALFDLVRGADVAFTNLEIVLSDRIGPPSDQMNLSADAEVAHDLRGLGFDIVGIANNHTWNYGPVGIRRTVAALRHAGLAHAGAGRNLHEARRPAFFETPKGRVALVAAASTFAAGQQATDQRADAPGRPGLNPQRYQTTYVVDPPAMEHLRRVAERTGLDKARRRMIERGTAAESKRDELSMLGATFREGADFAVTSVPHAGDLAENLRWIRDARRFADLVLVSMHCHEVEGEKGMPPRFLIEFARACIEAGAAASIGRGPRALRGPEIRLRRLKPGLVPGEDGPEPPHLQVFDVAHVAEDLQWRPMGGVRAPGQHGGGYGLEFCAEAVGHLFQLRQTILPVIHGGLLCHFSSMSSKGSVK